MSIEFLPTELLAQILVHLVDIWSESPGYDWTFFFAGSQTHNDIPTQNLLNCAMVNRNLNPCDRGELH